MVSTTKNRRWSSGFLTEIREDSIKSPHLICILGVITAEYKNVQANALHILQRSRPVAFLTVVVKPVFSVPKEDY